MNTSSVIAPVLGNIMQPQELAPRYEHVGFVPVALGVLRQMKVAEIIDEGLTPKQQGPQHTKGGAALFERSSSCRRIHVIA